MTERAIQNQLYWRLRSGAACLMPNFTPGGWWECDLAVVTKARYFVEYEIKLSAGDLRADSLKETDRPRMMGVPNDRYWMRKFRVSENKHGLLKAGDVRGPSRFYFVTLPPLADSVPSWAGVYVVIQRGGRFCVTLLRNAPQLHRHKTDRRFVREMMRSGYYRMWDLRCRLPEEATEAVQATT